jgi:gliding motility-associated-like protein
LPDQCTSYPSIVLPDPIVTPVQNTTGIGNYFGALVATADIPGKFKFTPPKIGASSFVFYKYETQNGCITIDTSSIKLFPTPIVNAGPDIQLLQDSVIKINASASNGINMRYRWSPTTYLDNPNILQPNIEQPRSDVAYVLTAFGTGPSNFNCISKDTVFLTSLNYLNPPNTLVPGRPPYDKWVIDNIQKYKGCMLKIFDINGSIIKSYDNGYDNNKPWDGTNQKNQFVPAGTYYYILDPKNGRKIQTGYVTIHR